MSIGYDISHARRHSYHFSEAKDSFKKDGVTVSLACYSGYTIMKILVPQMCHFKRPYHCFIYGWISEVHYWKATLARYFKLCRLLSKVPFKPDTLGWSTVQKVMAHFHFLRWNWNKIDYTCVTSFSKYLSSPTGCQAILNTASVSWKPLLQCREGFFVKITDLELWN